MQGKNKERTERVELRLTPTEKNTLKCLSFLRNQTMAEVLLTSLKAMTMHEDIKLRLSSSDGYDDKSFCSEAECVEWYCEYVDSLKYNDDKVPERIWSLPFMSKTGQVIQENYLDPLDDL